MIVKELRWSIFVGMKDVRLNKYPQNLMCQLIPLISI